MSEVDDIAGRGDQLSWAAPSRSTARFPGAPISVADSTGILFDFTGSGAAVTSTGGQTYNGTVTLEASTSLVDTGGNENA